MFKEEMDITDLKELCGTNSVGLKLENGGKFDIFKSAVNFFIHRVDQNIGNIKFTEQDNEYFELVIKTLAKENRNAEAYAIFIMTIYHLSNQTMINLYNSHSLEFLSGGDHNE